MYFLDTFAMIEYLKGNPGYINLIKNKIFYTSDFQLMELYYITLKEQNEESAERYFEVFALVRVSIPEKTLKSAMKKRLELKKNRLDISYIDAIGYQYAVENNLKFATGDSAFEKLEEVEYIPE